MSKYIGEYLYDWASKKDELIIQGICEEKYNRLLDCYDYSFDANKLATYVIGRINNEEKEIR